jgi:prepilin signal peptidase PulO-like enzyme (type II secretory pathway)
VETLPFLSEVLFALPLAAKIYAMTDALSAVLGALAGLALGWLTWLAAARFTGRYRAVNTSPSSGAPAGHSGRVSLGAAPTLALMLLWGAWVGSQAASLAVAVCALVVTGLLLCISLVDWRVRRIPDELALALLAWAVVQMLWIGQPAWGSAALGLLAAGGIFFGLAVLGRGALGIGDVKLEAAAGALLGFPVALAAIFAGILAGGVAAIFLLLIRRAGRKDTFAYGPYLALGAWLVYTRVLGLWPG